MTTPGQSAAEDQSDPRDDGTLPIATLRQIDEVCGAFESAWQSGTPVSIEDCLTDSAGQQRASLLRELLALELEYRGRRGDQPHPAEYLARFPGDSHVVALVFREAAGTPAEGGAQADRAADAAGRIATEFAIPACLQNHPRYRVLRVLGHGGMGTVFLAEHRLMARPVALKVLRPELLAAAGYVDRFLREVKAAASLNHPNIVAAYDAETAQGFHFLVMEYVPGTDLATLVANRGPLPVALACNYIRQAAAGLQHAHEHGMVHRDIKPQNLMLTPDGQVKVLDFGLAHIRPEALPAQSQTFPGTLLGSADYMAPEQAATPHAADIRADLYSLGCTLYFLLAGQPPFPAGSLLEKLRAHAEQSPREIRELRADVPPELAAVLGRMMRKDRAARQPTPAAVAAALAPWDTSGPAPEHPPADSQPSQRPDGADRQPATATGRRLPWAWTVVALAVLVAAVLAIVVGPRYFAWYFSAPAAPSAGDPVLAHGTTANELYEKGQALLAQREQRQAEEAIQCFTAAIELAPGSALAPAALANAYNLCGDYAWAAPNEVFPKARRAAEQALQRNDQLAEAHLALAFTLAAYELDWAAAQAQFQRALELKPDSADAHHWYAWFLLQQGRQNLKAAEEHIAEARRLAPLDPIILCNLGKIEYYGGRPAAAVEKYREALQTYPRYPKTHLDLGLAYAELGQLDRANEEFDKAANGLAADDRDLIAARAYALARNGRPAEARPLLAQLERWAPHKPLDYEIATIYAALGEKDAAFTWLQRAFDGAAPSAWRSYVKVDPKLDGLRGDERFAAFLTRAGLAK